MLRALLSVVCAAAVCGCGVPTILPPRTPPARDMPAVQLPAAPPMPGYGRIVVEATDGSMDVALAPQQRFTGGSATPMASGPLCRTPCVADVPWGAYTMYFSGLQSDSGRGDVATVYVGDGLTVLRRAPGLYRTPSTIQVSPLLFGLGSIALITTGSTLLATEQDNAVPGAVLVIGGVAMLIGALATTQYNAEQQAGSSTIWTEPIAPPRALSSATSSSPTNTNPVPVEVTP